MRFGIVVTDDDPIWGGEKGVGEYIVKRFEERNSGHDEFIVIQGVTGKLPSKKDILTYDGFLFTGSHHSVNDELPWIRRLEVFVRQAYQISLEFGRPRMVGICFGHQLIAKALGGRVGQNPDQEFNFGSVDVQVDERFLSKEFTNKVTFKKRRKSSITMMKFHGECVVDAPEISTPVGYSDQCQHEILMYGNTVLTTQGHPEYTKNIMEETNSKIMSRIGKLEQKQIKNNLNSIDEEDVDNCTDMINAFLHHLSMNLPDKKSLSVEDKQSGVYPTKNARMLKRMETTAG